MIVRVSEYDTTNTTHVATRKLADKKIQIIIYEAMMHSRNITAVTKKNESNSRRILKASCASSCGEEEDKQQYDI